MRFAIDAHAIGSGLTGNERYIRNLSDHLLAQDHKNEFCLFFTHEHARRQWEKRAANLQTFLVSENPYRRLGLDFPMQIRRLRPELFHYQYTGPLVRLSPEIVTIHDVSFVEHPEFFSTADHFRLLVTVRRAVRSARIILTVSEFSKREMVRIFNVPESKIRVIYNGVGPEFRPLDALSIRKCLERYGLQSPYFLSVGNICRRKNQLAVVRAFAQWVNRRKSREHRLVLVGKQAGSVRLLQDEIQRLGLDSSRIVLLGYVADGDLPALYAGAELFLFASLYEGFGLPVIEAMACGTPAVVSQSSCFPEIAGDAALFVDPQDPGSIADAIGQLTECGALRQDLVAKGFVRAQRFQWETAARETLKAYSEATATWGG